MNRGSIQHPKPSAAEETLFKVWDIIDQARARHGEQTAADLARKALAAIACEVETSNAH